MSPTQEGPTIKTLVAVLAILSPAAVQRVGPLGHRRQPLAILIPVTTHRVKVHGLQFLG